jgi:hypothetical protein
VNEVHHQSGMNTVPLSRLLKNSLLIQAMDGLAANQ